MAGTNPTRSEWDGRSVNLIFNGWTDSFLKPTFIGVWRFMVFLSVVPSPIAAFCQVVLTEVMFDPIGSEQSDEFVEVYNTGELPIDLKGWVVGDGSKFNRIVGAGEGTLLAPGQYGIILDLDYFGRSTAYEELVPDEACLLTIQGVTFGNGGLANSFSERLQVCDPEGVVMAEYWTTPGNVAGHSDEKIDLERSDEPDNWTESITLHGSPGTVNTVARNRYDLKITASVIDPDRPRRHHPFTVRVRIVNQGKRAVSAWTTRFFEDINGDSGAGPDEIWDIQTVDFEYFEPGDSMEVQSRSLNLEPGTHRLGVVVEYEEEERSIDKKIIFPVQVGFLPGDVIINEIMYAPLAGQPEWIELFNGWTSPVNLDEWGITDSDTAHRGGHIEGIELPVGGLCVVAQDSSLLWIFPPWEGGISVPSAFPRLNNDGDGVILFDPTGVVIDRVDYQSSWGGGKGFSMERYHPRSPSQDPSSWMSSVSTEGGTPGRKNSRVSGDISGTAHLHIDPNPFSPDGDGYEDEVRITYGLPSNDSHITVKIFDVYGRCVRTLAAGMVSGASGFLMWDGRDEHGRLGRIGLYIVFLEQIDQGAGSRRSSMVPLVLARR